MIRTSEVLFQISTNTTVASASVIEVLKVDGYTWHAVDPARACASRARPAEV